MHEILERNANGELWNRTYYDLPPGFRRYYLSEWDVTMMAS